MLAIGVNVDWTGASALIKRLLPLLLRGSLGSSFFLPRLPRSMMLAPFDQASLASNLPLPGTYAGFSTDF